MHRRIVILCVALFLSGCRTDPAWFELDGSPYTEECSTRYRYDSWRSERRYYRALGKRWNRNWP